MSDTAGGNQRDVRQLSANGSHSVRCGNTPILEDLSESPESRIGGSPGLDFNEIGAALTGDIDRADAGIHESLGRPRRDAHANFFRDNRHIKTRADGFNGGQQAAPVGVAILLHQFLKTIQVNNQSVCGNHIDRPLNFRQRKIIA